MMAVDIREIGFGSKLALCWSFFWRGFLVSVGSILAAGLAGGLLGGLVGFVFAFAGLSRQGITGASLVIGSAVGLATAFASLYLFIRWLLGSRLGSYRLILVPAGDRSAFHETAAHGS
jgi:hypothetical protein